MSVERIIGIDFGTSTSVVKIKTYNGDQPLDAKEMADYVRFDNKDSLPTLVYETTDNRYLVGYEAENAAVKGVLHQNFKLDLINPDPDKREEAMRYCEIFLKYLCDTYNDQKNHFPSCDMETTYISYPAKWSDDLKNQMIGLAKKVGFKNVDGLDEPTAAIHTVMVQESEKLVLNEDSSANILMIDMGAGTTDLVLCRYSPEEEQQISVINTWPKAGSPCLFGGREIDEILCEYVKAYLVNCGLPNTKNFKERYMDKCKTWKERNISPIFDDKNGVVRYCGFVDTLVTMLGVDVEFPPLSRDAFEDMLRDYIIQFTIMVNDCLDDAGFNRDKLDYVILTGGHSQWYFTNEILDGTLLKFGRIELPKIREDKSRVIKLSRPQETVALGLVYQKISVKPAQISIEPPAEEKVCSQCGERIPENAMYCPQCGTRSEDKYTPNFTVVEPSEETKGDVYTLPAGKNSDDLVYIIDNFLSSSRDMDTQTITLDDGHIMLQARDKGGTWKQWVGLDKAITVKIEQIEPDKIRVNIGEAKWADKVGIMALSFFVLWPLSITSGLGMYMQGKLPGEIKKEITQYLAS